ncbi:ATP-binding protein [Aneurinibacillus sp. REN35]|uniref:ATP-binding protein n=1 Tax=Aneurinibacillus sp. REN35 TaxID=3237286 RepID=UPI003528DFAF
MHMRPLTLQTRIVMFALSIVSFIIIGMGLFFYVIISEKVEAEVGQRALSVAQIVANIPELRRAFASENPSTVIQPIAELVRKNSGAEFIVVGNRQGIRYSHPLPDRIGKQMVGGDNTQALELGHAVISKATGSLGPSLRGKAPIFNDKGVVIGVVSVGFMIKDINETVSEYRDQVLGIAILAMLLGGAGAIYLARHIKNKIFGLEPEEIASLFTERSAMIESVREGIVMVDRRGRITLANQAAYDILSLSSDTSLVGRSIADLFPHTKLIEVMKSGEKQYDRQMDVNGQEIIVNRVPVLSSSNRIEGAVASFRRKSEIDQLTKELSQVKRYADALRAQTHEFSNTLYTISGLLQLESYEEAIQLIHEQTEIQQDIIQLIMQRLPDPWMGAIVLGLYNKARELKIAFEIDPHSELDHLPTHLNRQHLVSILGNLITNAFEAVQKEMPERRKVKLFFTNIASDIVIEVEDGGSGVPDKAIPYIFDEGFSTKKGERRGFGLAHIKGLLEEMGGYCTVERGEEGGALFTVVIPKEGRMLCDRQAN